jgi:PPOX class probable F420-dependent enzyme
MHQRARIAMTGDEVAAFLAASHKLQLATVNRDGTPHLVPMFYALLDGLIHLWTYAKSQKARNLERDPRLTCLVEAGEAYHELRGVMVYGTAERITDPERVLAVGLAVAERMAGGAAVPREAVEHTARKRVAFAVHPTRVVSWDHRKPHGPRAG